MRGLSRAAWLTAFVCLCAFAVTGPTRAQTPAADSDAASSAAEPEEEEFDFDEDEDDEEDEEEIRVYGGRLKQLVLDEQ